MLSALLRLTQTTGRNWNTKGGRTNSSVLTETEHPFHIEALGGGREGGTFATPLFIRATGGIELDGFKLDFPQSCAVTEGDKHHCHHHGDVRVDASTR